MRLGIFSKIFPRASLGETLDAVRSLGISSVQFNGPGEGIREEFERRQIKIEVLSATFNIIHPDPKARRVGFERFATLASSAKELDASILSVCTGTYDLEDMWRKHPKNESSEAWREMVTAMAKLATIAEEHDVTIAFEPEQANVIDSASKARALLDALQSRRVKVLMDAANLLTISNLAQQEWVLKEAFELVGYDIAAAHAKEFSADGTLGQAAIGRGVVDFPLYVSLLGDAGFQNSLIMHGFLESEARESTAYLSQLM
jgi:sugar phosphate isomerase/epimerase